jgi:hypothetical protein
VWQKREILQISISRGNFLPDVPAPLIKYNRFTAGLAAKPRSSLLMRQTPIPNDTLFYRHRLTEQKPLAGMLLQKQALCFGFNAFGNHLYPQGCGPSMLRHY